MVVLEDYKPVTEFEAAVTTLATLGESGVGVLSSLEARSIVADEKCEKRKEEEEEIAVNFEDD
ncbi:hypothetical protein BY996DRAFT_6458051 [Phakopsora pachyrhizi]|nr:hypothetical protein BY996DRAFT_6458051 [Phakopsora pachyrhizi]